MIATLVAVFLTIYAVKRVYIVLKAQTSHDGRLPRLYTTIQPMSALGAILPRTPFHRGIGFQWDERDTMYKDADLKTVVVVPLLYGRGMIYTSSLPFFHKCLALNAPFGKPDMGVLEIMGENVITTEGDAWKRHRRVTGPAFNHSTYRNVWDTVANVYADMLKQEGWLHADETPPANFNEITHKIALFLIAIVGFNIPMTWYEPPRDKRGHLSVQAMVFEVASHILERSQLPKWTYSLGFQKLKNIDEAYSTFEKFMYGRITEREAQFEKIRAMEGSADADVADSIKDVFGRLVNARLADGKNSLSDEEIIGNCFVFTFAGHETSANALVMTLSLLALHPDKQEWVYDSIRSAVGDRIPTFDDYDVLDNVLACFYEALRMYPSAYLIPRVASEDSIVSVPRRDDPELVEQLSVKKGTAITLDLIGMYYDSQTFTEPESFKPERWIKSDKPSSSSITKDTEAGEVSFSTSASGSSLDSFIGFSFGPRTCLGHKFAKVEAVAFLTLLLREWRVELVLKEGETREGWRERVMGKPELRMTLTVGEVPLKLVRRE